MSDHGGQAWRSRRASHLELQHPTAPLWHSTDGTQPSIPSHLGSPHRSPSSKCSEGNALSIAGARRPANVLRCRSGSHSLGCLAAGCIPSVGVPRVVGLLLQRWNRAVWAVWWCLGAVAGNLGGQFGGIWLADFPSPPASALVRIRRTAPLSFRPHIRLFANSALNRSRQKFPQTRSTCRTRKALVCV